MAEFNDDYYWNSYAHFGIHEQMLQDSVRTKGYMSWIYRNKDLFADKVVLDVGCGTGILSMFAAKAGARKVYAVDASNIVHTARRLVSINNFDDQIEVIEGKVEDIDLPEKVDIIISEWLGYCCYYEAMLTSVLVARNRFLKDDGIMAPDRVTFKLSGIEDAEYKDDKMNYWNNVYGFDFSIIRDQVKIEPLVDYAPSEAVVTDYVEIHELNTETIDIPSSGTFVAPFTLTAKKDDVVHALVAHFDVGFTHGHSLWFTTGPDGKRTHWKQTVFYLDDDIVMYEGEELSGVFELYPNKVNPRELDIKISYKYEGRSGPVSGTQLFKLQ
ncbi:hypothetical protein RCL1_001651 [Eukaryota sp. TZLM3-RCL]